MKPDKKIIILFIISVLCLLCAAVFLTLARWYTEDGATVAAADVPSEDTTVVTELVSGEAEQVMDESEVSTNLCLDIFDIQQNPELPNGCEIVSLAIVLQYMGYDIDKCELSDNYLPKGEVGTTSPLEAFVGDPAVFGVGLAFGCYAPVIVRTANSFFADIGSTARALNVSGTPLDELCDYLLAGQPVIIWGTVGMEDSSIATTWMLDGAEYNWLTLSHTSVLIGYTATDYIFVDPLQGIVSYYREDVESCYKMQYMQAVVIEN